MTDKDSDEEVLADLIQKWEDLRDMGQHTPPEVLCADHPHLLPELKRRIEILGVTSWLDEPLPSAGTDDPQPSPTNDPLLSRVLGGRYRIEKLVARGGFVGSHRRLIFQHAPRTQPSMKLRCAYL